LRRQSRPSIRAANPRIVLASPPARA
jgi:hypothetical protein